MAGRAEHFRAKAKHAQRSVTYEKPERVTMESWLHEVMEACRTLAGQTANSWGLEDFQRATGTNFEQANEWLRKLSSMGFLHMTVERDGAKFVRYVWGMVDVNLPRT